MIIITAQFPHTLTVSTLTPRERERETEDGKHELGTKKVEEHLDLQVETVWD